MAIKIIITGENADEVYEQLMNLSKVPDYYYRPYEYDQTGKVIGHNDHVVTIGHRDSVVTSDTPKEVALTPTETIESDTLKYENVSEEDLRKMAEELVNKHGRKALRAFRDQEKIESFKSLSPEQRAAVASCLGRFSESYAG